MSHTMTFGDPITARDNVARKAAARGLKVGDKVRIIHTQWAGCEGIIRDIEGGTYSNSKASRFLIYVETHEVVPSFSFVVLDPRNIMKINRFTSKGKSLSKKLAEDWRRI